MATLEQLDNWGSMDALDSYGNLEQLDTLTLHQPTAAVSFAATASSTMKRILAFAASVSGVASVSVLASFIAKMIASISVAATSSATMKRIQHFEAAVATSATASGIITRLRGMLASVELAVTAASENAVIFVMSALADVAVTQTTVARRIGDDWTVVPGEGEIWTVINPFPATLEELDQLGNLEQLDRYGSIDDFDDFDIIIPNMQWATQEVGTERWSVK